ncbi:MAG TPA: N-acetylmuramoyl-L-alanine amidase, partial [Roseiflexaceae bacterium]|nr:N-acetylmuramoyl-L-alanine amidase [Roseiflexaceae bacterium]
MIVLHSTVGSARSALAWLTNPAAQVSAHYLIDKGGRIYRLVPDELCAWHAGRAEWKGQTAINELSLGIELENANNGRDPYPTAQLDALVELSREKVSQYGIRPDMVVRHVDVALPRGRKSDPAGFPWAEYVRRGFGDLPPPAPERP